MAPPAGQTSGRQLAQQVKAPIATGGPPQMATIGKERTNKQQSPIKFHEFKTQTIKDGSPVPPCTHLDSPVAQDMQNSRLLNHGVAPHASSQWRGSPHPEYMVACITGTTQNNYTEQLVQNRMRTIWDALESRQGDGPQTRRTEQNQFSLRQQKYHTPADRPEKKQNQLVTVTQPAVALLHPEKRDVTHIRNNLCILPMQISDNGARTSGIAAKLCKILSETFDKYYVYNAPQYSRESGDLLGIFEDKTTEVRKGISYDDVGIDKWSKQFTEKYGGYCDDWGAATYRLALERRDEIKETYWISIAQCPGHTFNIISADPIKVGQASASVPQGALVIDTWLWRSGKGNKKLSPEQLSARDQSVGNHTNTNVVKTYNVMPGASIESNLLDL